MMLKLAAEYAEYADGAAKVKLVETSSGAYYGAGYQDVQNHVPKIDNTMAELDWKPTVDMADALRNSGASNFLFQPSGPGATLAVGVTGKAWNGSVYPIPVTGHERGRRGSWTAL